MNGAGPVEVLRPFGARPNGLRAVGTPNLATRALLNSRSFVNVRC